LGYLPYKWGSGGRQFKSGHPDFEAKIADNLEKE
jgi:hypothetical protein